MPAVYGEKPATRDCDGCWYAEVGQRVGRDVCHGRVGGELEHHDDILLHLILKHQRALGKETLVRQTEKEKRKDGKGRREKGRGRRVGWSKGGGVETEEEEQTEQMGQQGGRGKGRLVGAQGLSRYTH